MNLPNNFQEIRDAASSMFKDPATVSVVVESTMGEHIVSRNGVVKPKPKATPWLNHSVFPTKEGAEGMADRLIGGGIIQEQGDGWHCFGAREFQEKVLSGEIIC